MELHEKKIKNIVEEALKLKNDSLSLFSRFQHLELEFHKKIRQNPSLILQHLEDWKIVKGFDSYKKIRIYKYIRVSLLKNDDVLREFVVFLINYSIVYKDENSECIKKALLQRLFGLNTGISLSAFGNELSAYIHFKKLGFNVEFYDLGKGKESVYDLEILKDGHKFSVECKEIQSFCGSPIYSDAGAEFVELLHRRKCNLRGEDANIIEFNFDGILTKVKNSKIIDNQITPDELIAEYDLGKVSMINIKRDYPLSPSVNQFSTIMNEERARYLNAHIGCIVDGGELKGKYYITNYSIYILNTSSKGNIKNIIIKRIEKAIKQVSNTNPFIISMYLKGADLEFFENTIVQQSIIDIVNKTLINQKMPWSILFRGEFNLSTNIAPMYRVDSKDFKDSYNELFKGYFSDGCF